MAKRAYYFNLINTFKTEVTTLVESKPCIQSSAVTAAISELKWFNLPNKIKDLVAAINATTPPGGNYTITNKYWYKLVDEVNNLLSFLEAVNCS